MLTAANSDYMLGQFDGTKFTPETEKLKGQRGRGYYAAQTFADIPAADGRRIQIGWLQAPSPGMPFNQCMSIPLELTLRSTPAGPRLAWQPVKELEALRTKSHRLGPLTLAEGEANPLARAGGELLELRAEFEPGSAAEVAFTVRGVPIVYDAKAQEIAVDNHRAPAPLCNGRQRLIVYVDRTAMEVFASRWPELRADACDSQGRRAVHRCCGPRRSGAIRPAGRLRIELGLAQVTWVARACPCASGRLLRYRIARRRLPEQRVARTVEDGTGKPVALNYRRRSPVPPNSSSFPLQRLTSPGYRPRGGGGALWRRSRR